MPQTRSLYVEHEGRYSHSKFTYVQDKVIQNSRLQIYLYTRQSDPELSFTPYYALLQQNLLSYIKFKGFDFYNRTKIKRGI